MKHLKHRLVTCVFTLLPYDATQAGDGQAEGSAVAAPFGGERRGQRGQATGELWPGCELPTSQARGGEGGDRPMTA